MHGLIVKYIPIIQIYGILPLNVNTCVLNFQRRQFLLDFLVVVEKPICFAVFISDIKIRGRMLKQTFGENLKFSFCENLKYLTFFVKTISLSSSFVFPHDWQRWRRKQLKLQIVANWKFKYSKQRGTMSSSSSPPSSPSPCHHRHHHHHHHHHNDDDHHSFPHNVMFLISIQIWRQMGAAV